METIQQLLSQDQVPAIEVDDQGLISRINGAFEAQLGWSSGDLAGQALTTIIPVPMRTVHSIGFSRFLATEKPTLLNKPLRLTILLKDGRTMNAEHLIMAEKRDGRWYFGATIKPQG